MSQCKITMELAEKVVEHFNNTPGATVRSTADACETPKSTVHKILTKVLPNETSRAKLDENKKDSSRRAAIALHKKKKRE